MQGRYEVNPQWISHPRWTPGARLTLRAQIRNNGAVDPAAARHALNDWLATLRPAWITLDGRPQLVAFNGGAFIELATPEDAAAVCPDVLISAAGEDACESVGQLAGALHDSVRASLPHAEFEWEELEPRPFGRQ